MLWDFPVKFAYIYKHIYVLALCVQHVWFYLEMGKVFRNGAALMTWGDGGD